MQAENFDILGIFAFLFFIIIFIYQIKNKKILSKWVYVIALIIAILGFIVDLYIVFTRFLI